MAKGQQKPQDGNAVETANNKRPQQAEQAVRFRFDQHSFSHFGKGVQGETREISASDAAELVRMNIGKIIG